jgi:hypothetical protein
VREDEHHRPYPMRDKLRRSATSATDEEDISVVGGWLVDDWWHGWWSGGAQDEDVYGPVAQSIASIKLIASID